MRLINILTRKASKSAKRSVTDPEARWRDPLSHPDISSMSGDQLADLPFDPRRILGDTEPGKPCAMSFGGGPSDRPAGI